MFENLKNKNILKFMPVAVIAIPVFLYLFWNTARWEQREEFFRKTKINSRILELTDVKRGYYSIKLHVRGSIMEFRLPISYEVKKDSIVAGDSLSKEALSGKFEVFRSTHNNRIIKVSEGIIY